ncbi:uncharacterized protein CCOS01_02984 [Colletotrichum costaricense]|uniref:Uncharacterized protein n=1 Tax=Colletotrichum costaricense TaxID=1209916 RepID=A0AAJ0E3G7_9PEZI|nr:uncharacterized protein CCOS01_02984 [Colletotrichum costaricense]KAK1534232.1 hypothetical protein CCOS01_02984 [Colletotrichum costaricense]
MSYQASPAGPTRRSITASSAPNAPGFAYNNSQLPMTSGMTISLPRIPANVNAAAYVLTAAHGGLHGRIVSPDARQGPGLAVGSFCMVQTSIDSA